MTIAQTVCETIDIESGEGVRHQVTNWCACNENLVVSIENQSIYAHATLIDHSAVTFDDYSVSPS
jgi:hypothetical protein